MKTSTSSSAPTPPAAQEYFEQGLAIFREIGDRRGEAICQGGLGLVYLALGADAEAQELQERHLRLSHEIGNPTEEGNALMALGLLADRRGDVKGAVAHLEDAVALNRKVHYIAGTAEALAKLGRTLRGRGEEGRASTCFEEALSLGEEHSLGRTLLEVTTLCAAGVDGDVPRARAALTAHGDHVNVTVRMAARFGLWKATAELKHLKEARRLLAHVVDHAPETFRESMLKNVRLYRAIGKA